MEKIAVMIADDHPVVRNAIIKSFVKKPHIDFCGEANNGLELLQLVKASCPDIAVIDLEMPEMNGYDTISELHNNYPQVKTIAFSGFLDLVTQQRAISLGAFSTVSKTEPVSVLLRAIEMTTGGKHFHSNVMRDFSPEPDVDDKYSLLTLREKQIFESIAQGKTSKQISREYNISKWTVDKHRSNIKEKLEIKNIAGLIRYAIERKQM